MAREEIMSGLGSYSGIERPWSMYTSSDPNPLQLAAAAPPPPPQREIDSSMSAISFGFAATAILISMFLVMAIFEHLFKPTQAGDNLSLPRSVRSSMQKHLISSETEDSRLPMPVVMPGHQGPTHIAKPAPLALAVLEEAPRPCSREGVKWPQHSPN